MLKAAIFLLIFSNLSLTDASFDIEKCDLKLEIDPSNHNVEIKSNNSTTTIIRTVQSDSQLCCGAALPAGPPTPGGTDHLAPFCVAYDFQTPNAPNTPEEIALNVAEKKTFDTSATPEARFTLKKSGSVEQFVHNLNSSGNPAKRFMNLNITVDLDPTNPGTVTEVTLELKTSYSYLFEQLPNAAERLVYTAAQNGDLTLEKFDSKTDRGFFFKVDRETGFDLPAATFSLSAADELEIAAYRRMVVDSKTYFVQYYHKLIVEDSSGAGGVTLTNLSFKDGASENSPASLKYEDAQSNSEIRFLSGLDSNNQSDYYMMQFNSTSSTLNRILFAKIQTRSLEMTFDKSSSDTAPTLIQRTADPERVNLRMAAGTNFMYLRKEGTQIEYLDYTFDAANVEVKSNCVYDRQTHEILDSTFKVRSTPQSIGQCLHSMMIFVMKSQPPLTKSDIQADLVPSSNPQTIRVSAAQNTEFVIQSIDYVLIANFNESYKYYRPSEGLLRTFRMVRGDLDPDTVTFNRPTRMFSYSTAISVKLNASDSPSVLIMAKDLASPFGFQFQLYDNQLAETRVSKCLRRQNGTFVARILANVDDVTTCSALASNGRPSYTGLESIRSDYLVQFGFPDCTPSVSDAEIDPNLKVTFSKNGQPSQGAQLSSTTNGILKFVCRDNYNSEASFALVELVNFVDDSVIIGEFDYLKREFRAVATQPAADRFRLETVKDPLRPEALYYRATLQQLSGSAADFRFVFKYIQPSLNCVAVSGGNKYLMNANNRATVVEAERCVFDVNISLRRNDLDAPEMTRFVDFDKTMRIYEKSNGKLVRKISLAQKTSLDEIFGANRDAFHVQAIRGKIYRTYEVFLKTEANGNLVHMVTFTSYKYFDLIFFCVLMALLVFLGIALSLVYCRQAAQNLALEYQLFAASIRNFRIPSLNNIGSYQSSELNHFVTIKFLLSSATNYWQHVKQLIDTEGLPAYQAVLDKSLQDSMQAFLRNPARRSFQQTMESTVRASVQSQNNAKLQAFDYDEIEREKLRFGLTPIHCFELSTTFHLMAIEDRSQSRTRPLNCMVKQSQADLVLVQESMISAEKDFETIRGEDEFRILSPKKMPYVKVFTATTMSESLLEAFNREIIESEAKSVLLGPLEELQAHYLMSMITLSNSEVLRANKYNLNFGSTFIESTLLHGGALDAENVIFAMDIVINAIAKVDVERFYLFKSHFEEVRSIDNQYWRKIKRTRRHSVMDAKSRLNAPFNRYADISPYDYNRIHLEPTVNSTDYINASPVNIVVKGRTYKFCACQGPLESTVNAFWHMVFQQHFTMTVKLTKNVEEGRIKCFEYLLFTSDSPKSFRAGTNDAGENLLVEELEKHAFGNAILRLLSITPDRNGVLKPELTMYHVHLAFNDWPDRGVISIQDASRLVFMVSNPRQAFGSLNPRIHECIESTMNGQSTMVVHCSAGVGRTGTLMCLVAISDQIASDCDDLDIPDIVEQGRECRNNFVQTFDQFKMLFEFAKSKLSE